MPYLIIKRGGKWKVYKKGKDGHPVGKALGTHSTKSEASAQRRAIYANEKTQMPVANNLNEYSAVVENPSAPVGTSSPSRTQAEANYVTESRNPLRHCSICRHFLQSGLCELVENTPDPIEDAGVCDLFSEIPVSQHEVDAQMNPEQNLLLAQVQEQEAASKGFIYLSLKWEWEIERIQSALYDIFGYNEGWTWVDGYLYHITLVYAPEIEDAQLLEAVKAIVGKYAPNLKFTGLGVFPSADGTYQTLYLKVEDNEELRILQRAIYDALTAQEGVTLSDFSNPDSWIPHVSLAQIPMDASVPLDAALDIEAWYVNKVCIARDDYYVLAELPLSYPDSYQSIDDGSAPTAEPLAQMAVWKSGAGVSNFDIDNTLQWDAHISAEQITAKGDISSSPLKETVKQAFLLYNDVNLYSPMNYRFPLAQQNAEGRWVTTEKAIRSAEQGLSRLTDVSEIERKNAQDVINHYKQKLGISEMQESVHITMISEMQGDYPDIPLPEDIDVEALGEHAFFVTLPIGQIGAKSRNNRIYTQTAVEELVAQINLMRPEGIWGHMTEEDQAHRYDPPSIRWLVAMIDAEGIAWGKALPLNEQTREYYRSAKATNARVGTSLVAWAEMDKGKNEVLHLELRWIDIADPVRVGVPMTAAKVQITKEMSDKLGDIVYRTAKPAEGKQKPAPEAAVPPVEVNEQVKPQDEQQERIMDEKEIQELQATNQRLTTQASEFEAAKTAWATEKATLTEQNTAFKTEIGVLLAEFIKSEVKEQVKLENFRGQAQKFVTMQQPQTREQVIAMVKAYVDDPDNQVAMKGAVAEQMGEPQTTPQGGIRNDAPAQVAKRDETNPVADVKSAAKELANSSFFTIPNLQELERQGAN